MSVLFIRTASNPIRVALRVVACWNVICEQLLDISNAGAELHETMHGSSSEFLYNLLNSTKPQQSAILDFEAIDRAIEDVEQQVPEDLKVPSDMNFSDTIDDMTIVQIIHLDIVRVSQELAALQIAVSHARHFTEPCPRTRRQRKVGYPHSKTRRF